MTISSLSTAVGGVPATVVVVVVEDVGGGVDVGATVGAAVVGAAVLLFSQVFKEPLKGITRGYYRITGPWENPTVERVDAAAIKVSEQQGTTTGK